MQLLLLAELLLLLWQGWSCCWQGWSCCWQGWSCCWQGCSCYWQGYCRCHWSGNCSLWLMLVQLLLLLLAELLTLLLELCCCWDCCCFRCFSFHHPGLSPVFKPSLPSSLAGALAALNTHPWRIHSGEVDTLIVSARFKTILAPAPVAMHSWYCARAYTAGRQKPGNSRAVAATCWIIREEETFTYCTAAYALALRLLSLAFSDQLQIGKFLLA